ncbi:hypothetical protein CBR_g46749 [Chara braunii]|uniref:AAA+ ATPase domain-containing protein n=1 Tax=Chara braunii TaxID=69332 RepID=A0A388K4C3_CHABU|nr:hypothetical protein CBR_g46749 [Chara braunii]|eukprot:GBG64793.1 hypothetical protein CBR_g46749 [Chara braunii]
MAKRKNIEDEKKKITDLCLQEKHDCKVIQMDAEIEITKVRVDLEKRLVEENLKKEAQETKQRVQAQISKLEKAANLMVSLGKSSSSVSPNRGVFPSKTGEVPAATGTKSAGGGEEVGGRGEADRGEEEAAGRNGGTGEGGGGGGGTAGGGESENEDPTKDLDEVVVFVSKPLDEQVQALFNENAAESSSSSSSPSPFKCSLSNWLGIASTAGDARDLLSEIIMKPISPTLKPGIEYTEDGENGHGWVSGFRYFEKLPLKENSSVDDQMQKTLLCFLCRSQDGIQGLEQLLQQLDAEGGGLLFVDEAYQLNPEVEFNGRRVLDYLLTEAENKIGKLAVAFAGYQNKIEKLLEYNEGLPSRFPYMFVFEDFSDKQLHDIFLSSVQQVFPEHCRAVTIEGGPEGGPMKILIRRIGRGRGRVGFGNARAVKNEVERVFERQATRVKKERDEGGNPDDFFFTKEDLLGPDPTAALARCKAWQKLKGMIGLKKVKEEVENLTELILRDLGFLSNGEVVVKKPSDFIGSVMGESEKTTRGILNACVGKVLVIDEAYGLYASASSSSGSSGAGGHSDIYRTAVVDTIVGEVQNVPGEDRCVLMLGYREDMERMMANSNPGLQRRFSLETAFVFEDFSVDELVKILNLKMSKLELQSSFEAQQCAGEVLAKRKRLKNFGNGGEVDNLLTAALKRMESRLKHLPADQRVRMSQHILPTDFDPDWECGSGGAGMQVLKLPRVEDLFSDLMSCDHLVDQMLGYQSDMDLARQRGRDPLQQIPMNFCFVGPPGTGKTTVARRMGKFMRGLGVLGSDEVVETSGASFLGQYVGQTGPKVIAMLEKALGKVLFIDEACQLNPMAGATSVYAKEAVDELVNQLTKPQFYRKLVIILAGYEDAIDSLLRSNDGLRSRFSETVVFRSFTGEQCAQLFKKLLASDGFAIEDDDQESDEELKELFTRLAKTPAWGNGRDINNIVKKTTQKFSRSIVTKGGHGGDGAKDEAFRGICAGSVLSIPMKMIRECLHVEEEKRRKGRSDQLYAPHGMTLIHPPLALQDMSWRTPATATLSLTSAEDVVQITTASSSEHKVEEILEAKGSLREEVVKQLQQGEGGKEEEEKREWLTSSPGNDGQGGGGGGGVATVVRDDGVTDQVWGEIQQAILREEAVRAAVKRQEEMAKQAEMEARRLEELARRLKEEEEENRKQQEAEEAARRAREKAEKERREAERLEMVRQKEEQVLKKIQQMGVCCMGYRWLKVDSGYRCAGGSHYMSKAEAGL